jgi:hypothetical protein
VLTILGCAVRGRLPYFAASATNARGDEMTDPKNQSKTDDEERDEFDLGAETVGDLDPDAQDAEKIAGGKPDDCGGTRPRCFRTG